MTALTLDAESGSSARRPADIVGGIAVARATAQCVKAFGIDKPQAGVTDTSYSLEIAGWLVGRNHSAVQVEVLSSGRLVKSVPVAVTRPDVTERHPDHPEPTGFVARVGLVGLPTRFELVLRVLLADGTRDIVAVVTGTRRPLPAPDPGLLQPLMVTSLGRMGTTWMMRLLAEHPEVTAYRDYPYELMPARYWAHQLRVLSAPADYASSSAPGSFAEDPFRVGHNPFYGPLLRNSEATAEWFSTVQVERLASFCRGSIEGFYRHVATLNEQPDPRFFAEKSLPDHLPETMRDLYPGTREVFLVRDLRDVVCSMLAFNSKRGYQSFGREKAGNDSEFVQRLAIDLSTLAAAWEARADSSLLVRYEDLVLQPEETLSRILAYLSVAADATTVSGVLAAASEETEELAAHRTSRDQSSSIGRWQEDLPADLAEECTEVFGPVMARFKCKDGQT
jgi:hypothetical protein